MKKLLCLVMALAMMFALSGCGEVSVEGVSVSSIEVTAMPDKTVYAIGDELDITGLEITATYENDATRVADNDDLTIIGFSSESASDAVNITVSYEKKTTTFVVQVEGDAVFEKTSLASDAYVAYGEDPEPYLLRYVTALDSFGVDASDEVTFAYSTGVSSDKVTGEVGTTIAVTATYGSATLSFNVTVADDVYILNEIGDYLSGTSTLTFSSSNYEADLRSALNISDDTDISDVVEITMYMSIDGGDVNAIDVYALSSFPSFTSSANEAIALAQSLVNNISKFDYTIYAEITPVDSYDWNGSTVLGSGTYTIIDNTADFSSYKTSGLLTVDTFLSGCYNPEADMVAGETGAWASGGSRYKSAEAAEEANGAYIDSSLDDTTGTVTLDVIQPSSGDSYSWWQCQYFAVFCAVEEAGTYAQALTFTSSVSGVICIQGTDYTFTAGVPKVIVFSGTFSAGSSQNNLSIQFAGGDATEGVGSLVFTIEGLEWV